MDEILVIIVQCISDSIPSLEICTRYKWLNKVIEWAWYIFVLAVVNCVVIALCLGVYWALKEAIMK